jgi:hypothetical protein
LRVTSSRERYLVSGKRPSPWVYIPDGNDDEVDESHVNNLHSGVDMLTTQLECEKEFNDPERVRGRKYHQPSPNTSDRLSRPADQSTADLTQHHKAYRAQVPGAVDLGCPSLVHGSRPFRVPGSSTFRVNWSRLSDEP